MAFDMEYFQAINSHPYRYSERFITFYFLIILSKHLRRHRSNIRIVYRTRLLGMCVYKQRYRLQSVISLFLLFIGGTRCILEYIETCRQTHEIK